MGTEDAAGFPADGEGPVRDVRVDGFRIDATAVTNREFAEFVEATNYRTDAETYGWSYVFHLFLSRKTLHRTPQRPVSYTHLRAHET